jgi:formate dehydrogenase major subunit
MLANAMGADWHYTHPPRSWRRLPPRRPPSRASPMICWKKSARSSGPATSQRPKARRSCMWTGSCAARGGSCHGIRGDGRKTGPRFPLLLTTGRILSQYNVGAQTRRTENTVWHEEDVLEIHPHDAELRGVKEGDWVKLASRSGETALRATLTDRVSPGVVYTTFHHPEHAGQCHHHGLLRLGHELPGIQGDGGAGVALQRPDRVAEGLCRPGDRARRILPAAE